MAAGQGRGSSALLPRALHHVHLDQIPLVDLAASGALDALGLSRDDVRAADWSKCQLIGETAALAGYAGLRAPSATGIGHVIVLFEALIPEGRVHLIKSEDLSPYL